MDRMTPSVRMAIVMLEALQRRMNGKFDEILRDLHTADAEDIPEPGKTALGHVRRAGEAIRAGDHEGARGSLRAALQALGGTGTD